MINIITGHNDLLYHQFKQDSFINPWCRLCGEEIETFIHFINDCPRLAIKRREILMNEPIQGTNSWAVEHILEFSRIPAIDVLLDERLG